MHRPHAHLQTECVRRFRQDVNEIAIGDDGNRIVGAIAVIADLDARLAKIGVPKLNGTEKAGEKTVPAIFFGERKINNNYDVVDSIRKSHDATATVFVKDGDEYVRVSTNVLTPLSTSSLPRKDRRRE